MAVPKKPKPPAPGAAAEPQFPPWKLARVDSLIPYPNNARTHSAESIDKLCRLIVENGWTNPILVAGPDILAGHARQLAAIKLKLAVVPVIDLSHLSALQRRAYILSDNRSALDAGWNDDLLRIELGALRDDGFDLDLTGFDAGELAGLFGDVAGLTDPDDVPGVPEVPVSQPGDVWLLGKHRVMCGDATNAGDVAKAMNGVKPHLMVTDPPYGVRYDATWRSKSPGLRKITPKTEALGGIQNDGNADWGEAWALFPGEVAYVWHAGSEAAAVAGSLISAGIEIRSQIIWRKHHFAIGRGHYHIQHEPCWYAVRKGSAGHWQGDRTQSTIWDINANLGWLKKDAGPDKRTEHSTQKPVECMKRPIENNSSPGQAVYDPFVGSGTTIIAAEMTGRACHAIEISGQYTDVSVLRWQAFVGAEATLESTGQSFTEVAAARSARVEAAA